MSAMSRFGPSVARSVYVQQQRHMASASQASEPVQRLFVDKIREFKTSNKGLDETHKKMLSEEMNRLKRVYSVADESKLTHLEYKFPQEHDVKIYDIETAKELRHKIHTGEYQKQLAAASKPKSELLATIPEPDGDEFHLPSNNKPDYMVVHENLGPPLPAAISESRPDYEYQGGKYTVAQIERDMGVHFSDNMPTIHDDKAPGRDAVNFPRLPIPLDTPPTRHHIIPESWFKFFYPKTGVSGPYTFAAAFGTFLFSKEWLVMEHEMLTGFSLLAVFSYAIPKFGPKLKAFVVNRVQRDVDGWDHWQKENIHVLDDAIKSYKSVLGGANPFDELYQARREEVELQVEAEYRNRLKTAYEDTKRRLNYLVSVADSQRQIQHANMVNWVISNVHSSFGPKQESEVLDNCILNLKQLAGKNANAI